MKGNVQLGPKQISFLTVVALIAIVVGVILEEIASFLPLIYFAVSFSILIIGYSIVYIRHLSRHKEIIVMITNILFALFMLMTFLTSYEVYKINLEANKPKLTTQLTTRKMVIGHFAKDFEQKIYEEDLNRTKMNLPLYLAINNYGAVNTQIYNVRFDACGGIRGWIPLPEDETTLIKPGEFFELSYSIPIEGNETIRNILPCKIYFRIYGPNFKEIVKTITLVEGES